MRNDKDGAAGNPVCKADWTSGCRSVSRAEVASSSIRMGAFFRMARAIERRWRSPPLLQTQAALADHGFVAVQGTHDEVMRQGRARRIFDCLMGNVGLSVGNVVAHRVIKQDGVLSDDGDLRTQRCDRQVADVVAVDQNTPARNIEEARKQVNQRGLAGAAGADDGQDFPGLTSRLMSCRTGHSSSGRGALVTKVDVLEANALMKRPQLERSRLLVNVAVGFEELKDGRRCADGLLKVVIESPELSWGRRA